MFYAFTCGLAFGYAFLMFYIVFNNIEWEKQAKHHKKDLKKSKRQAKNNGMSIAAATIDHIFENGTDFEDIKGRVLTITGRWAEYDERAYQGQKNSLKNFN